MVNFLSVFVYKASIYPFFKSAVSSRGGYNGIWTEHGVGWGGIICCTLSLRIWAKVCWVCNALFLSKNNFQGYWT